MIVTVLRVTNRITLFLLRWVIARVESYPFVGYYQCENEVKIISQLTQAQVLLEDLYDDNDGDDDDEI